MTSRVFRKYQKETQSIIIIFFYVFFIVGFGFFPISAQSEEKTATALIFSEPYLKKLGHPASIAYHYSHKTLNPNEYGAAFNEDVTVNVNPPSTAQGFNSVGIAMKTKGRNYELGPFENTSGNPVVMMFLERELSQMRSKVGGAPVYFRNTIRRAFREKAEIEETTVNLNGEQVPATRVTIRPFVDDQNAGRFGKFQGKVFETVVADAVPGGIFAMKSFVPGESGDDPNLVTNVLQYQPK